MKIIGLTGGIGTGKSTVCELLIKLDPNKKVRKIDLDKIAHQISQIGEKGYQAIVKEFGKEDILLPNKEINRKKLGEIIFQDPQKKRKLEKITHPKIIFQMIWELIIACLNGCEVVVVEVPLLFEAKMEKIFHQTIVVYSEEETQVERLIKNRGMTEKEARDRIKSQMSLKEKCKRADWIIDNSGNFDEMKKNCLEYWKINITKEKTNQTKQQLKKHKKIIPPDVFINRFILITILILLLFLIFKFLKFIFSFF
ncbi:bifunctional coenzyme a synthase-related [Anaeramoeba ignava]|uniref:Bifunctional coenzyme a synthase-related n=1 Tax=Anaeramoeba ignava TaxID=1746090 RepID=A0A9Q0R8C6_ANAIG|nr:bifunctional coenzyme a synthase-related [Anaeramoeba ignava]